MDYPDEWQQIAARKVEYPPPALVTASSDEWQLLSSGEVEASDQDAAGNELYDGEFAEDEAVPMTRRPGAVWDLLRRLDVRQASGWNTASRVFDSLSPRVRTRLLWGGAAVLAVFFIALLLGW